MNLQLQRPLCFLDIEATGLDPAADRVISLAIVKMFPGPVPEHGTCDKRYWLVNPGFPIPPPATAVHGITDAQVAAAPQFPFYAAVIMAYLSECDLAGFNCLNYDIPLLWEEFHRARLPWDLAEVHIVDVGNLFKKKEPRTLAAAVQFYCAKEIQEAHDASADAQATLEVFTGQLKRYPDLAAMDVAGLAEASRLEALSRIDLAGKLVRDADGDPVFNFAKVKGVKLRDDIGFARWMLDRDFSHNTKMHVRQELDKILGSPLFDDDEG